ncbi:FAD-dependent oxidoreductase [Catenovulum sp. 2E275]|uniref:FAD-dependent oxidoreductase n=1 Tax=Catenovulum sp. 2E275 TaxID=2980497 RepID=UPI0021D30CFA|nr:FAD-dependent oxidoreductase [Catenovulum sp. 2E275]MCU4675000.1 FAD-dependent oxidoreductase [Catenovulum sp. 2E275]
MKIAVVGAGLVGRLLAVQLAKHYQITLYDKDFNSAQYSAGKIAAAMLAPVAESVVASPLVVGLGELSVQLWPKLLSQLNQTVFYQQAGSLILAHAQDKGDLASFYQRLKLKSGIQAVNRQQIAELEPEIGGKFHQGLWLENEAQLDNRALYLALFAELIQAKVNLVATDDANIESDWVLANGDKTRFDWIFDCRGLGALPDLTQLRGVRGEVIRVYAPEVNLNRPVRLLHPRYPIYIVPKPNHEYVIGATEIESQSDHPMTVRSALELLSAAYSVHSGFAEAQITQLDVGLRPTLPDNEPAIVQDNRCIRINGLYRHGYLLAPAVIAHALNLFNRVSEQENTYFYQYSELSDNHFNLLYRQV